MGDPAPSVLLTDAQERSAPAACQSLGRAGYRVGGASSERPAPGQWSRFCDERFDVPDPRGDSREFARAIAEVAEKGRFTTVMPGSDAALVAISAHRDLFPTEVDLGLPTQEVLDACVSKVSLIGRAGDAGLAVPETAACADRDEAIAAAARLGYPVLLKPSRSALAEDGSIRQLTSFLAADEGALTEALSGFGLPCLLQRHFSGTLISIGGVSVAGEIAGLAVSRYIRTWPPRAGSVSCSETISASADLLDRVGKFVAATRWQGIFELELIEGEGGEFAAIDFNPRLYGSLALAVSAGAPLPAIWCDWLLRGRIERAVARPGVRYRWGDADFQHVGARLREGHPASAAQVLLPHRRTIGPYLRARDPAPALARCIQILQMVRRRLRGS
jgi:predicted ATP-grasp superfamily ATP-dependent carboligase